MRNTRNVISANIFIFLLLFYGASIAAPKLPDKQAVAIGTGGAIATVDPLATEAGLKVLKKGGNAIDAAVTAAAVLGVTEPYSAGIGGGGFMVIYLADENRVVTIDGREEGPSDENFDEDVFDGIPFFPQRITSGLAVGVPGTFATWVRALEEYGTIKLAQALQPGRVVAQSGFVVDETFAAQTASNAARFAAFTSTSDLFLPGGEVPAVGSVFRNRDLARTYHLLQRKGLPGFYSGDLAEEIVKTVQNPPIVDNPPFDVLPGLMVLADMEQYEVLEPDPTMIVYNGLSVFGMGPPSSGGITVGETLNILEATGSGNGDEILFWHHFLESTAIAFADRNAYIGDNRPEYEYVPITGLLSKEFASERAGLIGNSAQVKPVAPGDPCPYDDSSDCFPAPSALASPGTSTTHLVTSDRWGNVVSYTLTIEATGGSGIVVPGRGFLLNNELTDFDSGPNAPAPGKRPRSSMSPTIVLNEDSPFLAVGSPGGSTIITTVAEVLLNRIDRGMSLPEAIAAPRANQRNRTTVSWETSFPGELKLGLEGLGHVFSTNSSSEIGAVTGLEFLSDGRVLSAAEPVRRGGGDARVVRESRR